MTEATPTQFKGQKNIIIYQRYILYKTRSKVVLTMKNYLRVSNLEIKLAYLFNTE